jgi:ribbon-helix-helix CopG family protein
MKTKIYTKKPYLYRSFLLPESDARLWTAAAASLGLSQSEFLRRALREKAQQIFRGQYQTEQPREAQAT